jgi:hypothetical protein
VEFIESPAILLDSTKAVSEFRSELLLRWVKMHQAQMHCERYPILARPPGIRSALEEMVEKCLVPQSSHLIVRVHPRAVAQVGKDASHGVEARVELSPDGQAGYAWIHPCEEVHFVAYGVLSVERLAVWILAIQLLLGSIRAL